MPRTSSNHLTSPDLATKSEGGNRAARQQDLPRPKRPRAQDESPRPKRPRGRPPKTILPAQEWRDLQCRQIQLPDPNSSDLEGLGPEIAVLRDFMRWLVELFNATDSIPQRLQFFKTWQSASLRLAHLQRAQKFLGKDPASEFNNLVDSVILDIQKEWAAESDHPRDLYPSSPLSRGG